MFNLSEKKRDGSAAASVATFGLAAVIAASSAFGQPASPGLSKQRPPKPSPAVQEAPKKMPALSFKMKDIDGKKRDLRRHYGEVVLMVNVASKCGLTPHYEGLQKLYERYKDRGLVVLGFPANNFGKQEPGTNKEIKAFCTSKFQVSFPMFAKVSVEGDDICRLYRYLTDEKAEHGHGGEIPWNFTKILVNRKGEVAARFGPRTKPEDEKLVAAIEGELKDAAPKDSPFARKAKKKAREKKNG